VGVQEHFDSGLGHIPEDRQRRGLVLEFSIAENIAIHDYRSKPDSRFGWLSPSRLIETARRLIQEFDVRGGGPRTRAGGLSGGNQQRINIAIGLLARPSVLLLDEPSVGLDPRQRARLWEFVVALAAERGTTVIFSTHDIQEAERYGGRLLVLADGESLFDGPAAALREAVRREAPEAADRDFETAFVAYLHHRGH